MTKSLFAMGIAATMAVVACGDEEDPNPNPPRQQQQEEGLSSSFKSICASCHGDEGRGKDTYPAIPGSKDEAGFIAIVRSGKGDMPANGASAISDADLKSDFLWLTTKRK